MTCKFTVYGKPVGKGRPRFSTAGSYVRTYTPQKTVEFENLVRMGWMNEGFPMLKGNIVVGIDAYFPIPSSLSKKKQAALEDMPYDKKPDVDNICKSVLDALNSIAYDDDKQVVSVVIRKLYSATPRTVIIVSDKEDEDDVDY